MSGKYSIGSVYIETVNNEREASVLSTTVNYACTETKLRNEVSDLVCSTSFWTESPLHEFLFSHTLFPWHKCVVVCLQSPVWPLHCVVNNPYSFRLLNLLLIIAATTFVH